MKLNGKVAVLVAALTTVGAGLGVASAADTSASTTSSTASSTAPAHAGHWRHHMHGGLLVGSLLHATKQLNLTADQQQSIKSILSNARAQQRANAQNPQVDMTVLANPGDPNYATALQTAKTLAANRIQNESEIEGQIYNVLTPQQKAQLPQVLADMKAKFQQRRAAWQQRHQQDQQNATSTDTNG
jgi:Spy/CpxP family protein refolding chaperone